jgi:hypothetical protein
MKGSVMGGPLNTGIDDVFDDVGLVRTRFNHSAWERLRRETLGVGVHDPLGAHIGRASAGRYTPVSPFKQVLVGEFDHYGWYNPIFSGDEADFNIFIWNPVGAPFRHILDDVANQMEEPFRDLQKAQRRVDFCVECEVTPDESFYDNDFFPTDEPLDTPLVGRPIGVYGPWVRDGGHGGRPEIHPAEIIWWEGPRNRPGVRFTRHFLVLQDDSNRFDRPGDYDGPVPRPWSAFPRRANISVCLQPRAGVKNRYQLRVLRSRELHDVSNPGGQFVTGTHDGQKVVEVQKVSVHPNKIRVGLSDMDADPNGRDLRCFLHIGVEVGSGDRGDEGYALIRLETLD